MPLSLPPTLSTRDLYLNACRDGDLELARVLLTRGADVNWRRDKYYFYSGLHYAARFNYGDLLDLLLAQPGLEVNIRDKYNRTPLMVACGWGSENSVRKLLQVAGIKINCQDIWGGTALQLALENDYPGCIRILREASGLDWNLKDQNGDTPLLKAAFFGYADCLEIILSVPEPQVDFTFTDNNGYNVAWLALMKYAFEEEVEEEDEDPERCVELLTADPRVDWNLRDPENGNTTLHFCLKKGLVEVAKKIFKIPTVDLNVQNDAGEFPETIAR